METTGLASLEVNLCCNLANLLVEETDNRSTCESMLRSTRNKKLKLMKMGLQDWSAMTRTSRRSAGMSIAVVACTLLETSIVVSGANWLPGPSILSIFNGGTEDIELIL